MRKMYHAEENFTIEYPNGDGYHIHEDRIKDERDLLAWVMHLTEKTWMQDAQMVRGFVELVSEVKGFNLEVNK